VENDSSVETTENEPVVEETEKSLNEENDLEETETSVDNEENNSAE
ncbi:hypothetical protein HOI26_00005, partial [Candidatus Woesearchaeota archaeon]|nr:hypothetical protein [Candidatus Woesearchaeota archaeon]